MSLYFRINPKDTIKGKEAIKADNEKKEKEWQLEKAKREEQKEELEELMQGLTYEEIVARLKG